LTKHYVLPIEIEPLEAGGGYLATCESIQGCLAEGSSVAEAIDNLEDVARTLLQLRLQDGLDNPSDLRESADGTDHLHAEILVSVG
jgi:predicted RNase H-like HicB family nuclease